MIQFRTIWVGLCFVAIFTDDSRTIFVGRGLTPEHAQQRAMRNQEKWLNKVLNDGTGI